MYVEYSISANITKLVSKIILAADHMYSHVSHTSLPEQETAWHFNLCHHERYKVDLIVILIFISDYQCNWWSVLGWLASHSTLLLWIAYLYFLPIFLLGCLFFLNNFQNFSTNSIYNPLYINSIYNYIPWKYPLPA